MHLVFIENYNKSGIGALKEDFNICVTRGVLIWQNNVRDDNVKTPLQNRDNWYHIRRYSNSIIDVITQEVS